MKRILILVVLVILASGCTTTSQSQHLYREGQFASRLEYLRFCQHYHLYTDRCE